MGQYHPDRVREAERAEHDERVRREKIRADLEARAAFSARERERERREEMEALAECQGLTYEGPRCPTEWDLSEYRRKADDNSVWTAFETRSGEFVEAARALRRRVGPCPEVPEGLTRREREPFEAAKTAWRDRMYDVAESTHPEKYYRARLGDVVVNLTTGALSPVVSEDANLIVGLGLAGFAWLGNLLD